VVTAIAKYNFTEMARVLVNDCMDVMGGAGISRGPRNPIAGWHASAPIGITVEGANIVTRALMIFGQGALRAHPYAFREVQAVESNDLTAFDRVFCLHVRHIVRAAFRAMLLGSTRGHLARVPGGSPAVARYYQKISWASATFSILTDLAMLGLGGRLKSREKLSGRFADVMSWLYLGTATLRRFEAEGQRAEDRAFLDWSMQQAFSRIQESLDGILGNFDVPVLGPILAGPVRFLHRLNPLGTGPDDALGDEISSRMQVDGEQRDRLTAGVFQPEDPADPQSLLEHAFRLTARSGDILARVREAVRTGRLPRRLPVKELLDVALTVGVISEPEHDRVRESEKARDEALQVDSFSLEEYGNRHRSAGPRSPVQPLGTARLERRGSGECELGATNVAPAL
jgi:acyl-CoA dehydrogenase